MQMKRYIHSRPFIALTIIFLSFPCHSFLKTRFSTSCLHTWLVCQIFFLQVTCAPLFWTECFRCKVYLNTGEEVCQIRWSITFFELPYCASPTHNHRRTINSSDLRYWRKQCCYWFFFGFAVTSLCWSTLLDQLDIAVVELESFVLKLAEGIWII